MALSPVTQQYQRKKKSTFVRVGRHYCQYRFYCLVDGEKRPAALKVNPGRNEAVQSTYLTELLEIFNNENIEGAFVFTFIFAIIFPAKSRLLSLYGFAWNREIYKTYRKTIL